jgi:hypothetical protein
VRYKQLIQEKLTQLDSISRNLEGCANRQQLSDHSKYSELLREKVEEIRTLINTQTGQYE